MAELSVQLEVVDGPHLGIRFEFAGHDTFLVGRSRQAHFQLADKDKYFSRLHFLVEVNPPRCRLLDLGSHNGTFVNGERTRSAELRDGDEIKAGHTRLRVRVQRLTGDDGETVEHRSDEVVDLATAEWRDQDWPRIPGFEIEAELGRGGMGVVYRARSHIEGRAVAIKMLPSAGDAPRKLLDRFLREADILRQLDHPHIVRYLDSGESEGRPFFVMDLVLGSDVRLLLKERGRLPVRTATRVLCQVLSALEHAHERRFVHRDIKPANVLLEGNDGKLRVKLADFGLARIYQASRLSGLTLSGDIGGTVAFMAPEQITNYREVNPAADQYSAAAMLYVLLTGKPRYNFASASMQPLVLVLQEDPISILEQGVEMPKGLAEVVHQALAREPNDRFRDVGEFRAALLPYSR